MIKTEMMKKYEAETGEQSTRFVTDGKNGEETCSSTH